MDKWRIRISEIASLTTPRRPAGIAVEGRGSASVLDHPEQSWLTRIARAPVERLCAPRFLAFSWTPFQCRETPRRLIALVRLVHAGQSGKTTWLGAYRSDCMSKVGNGRGPDEEAETVMARSTIPILLACQPACQPACAPRISQRLKGMACKARKAAPLSECGTCGRVHMRTCG